MIQTYKDNLKRTIIAEYFSGNVQWGVKDSKTKTVESKTKFAQRVQREKWELISQK